MKNNIRVYYIGEKMFILTIERNALSLYCVRAKWSVLVSDLPVHILAARD